MVDLIGLFLTPIPLPVSKTPSGRSPRLGVQISPFFLPLQHSSPKKIISIPKSLEMIGKNFNN
jgi:hypothetical protein